MQTQLQKLEALLDLAETRGLHALDNSAADIFQRMRAVFVETQSSCPLYTYAELTPASRYALRRVRKPADQHEPRFFVHYGTHYDLRDFLFSKPGGFSSTSGGIVVQRAANNTVNVFPQSVAARPPQQALL